MIVECLKPLITNKITDFVRTMAFFIKMKTVQLLKVRSWRRAIITTNNQHRALTDSVLLELCGRQVQYST